VCGIFFAQSNSRTGTHRAVDSDANKNPRATPLDVVRFRVEVLSADVFALRTIVARLSEEDTVFVCIIKKGE